MTQDKGIFMEYDDRNEVYVLAKLDKAASAVADKLNRLKLDNKKLKDEVNELRRLLALSEKKAERLKEELTRLNSAGEQDWQIRERTIKGRLGQLAAKVAAFERIHSQEN